MSEKEFDIDRAMSEIALFVAPYPPAALFELAAAGFNSAFEQLVACIISIRTLDEVMLPTAKRLFARARTPQEISNLTVRELDQLIASATFHERKAQQIHDIAKRVVTEFNGVMPCDEELLLSFKGVGPKCANLVLGIVGGQPRIGVDIHVHRITNRWGYVSAKTPEKTLAALEAKLPQKYWVEINRILIPFGKNICTGSNPQCSRCPINDICAKIDVG